MAGRQHQWRCWTLGGALALVSAAAVFLILRPIVGGDLGVGDQIASVVGGVCGVLALLLGGVSALWPARSGGIDEQAEVETALGHLADRVRELSERAEHRWGINDPEPLPVRWHVVSDPLDDGDATEAHREQLTGTVSAVGRFYRSIPTGRMVVQGEPGSGKTVLAHHLVVTLCAEPDGDRRIPVLFRLKTWDPQVELHTWLAEQLSRDYPGLVRELPTGSTLAAMLVSQGRILPVLDGFDEIPDELRDEAIEGLSRFHGPLIVTTRRAEHGAITARTRTVANSTAIALDAPSLEDVQRHLGGRVGDASATAWTDVFDRLKAAPDEPASRELAAVLSVPLMVMLARTVYRHTDDGTPTELLDISQATGRDGLEEHLLSRYLDTVYDERYVLGGGTGSPTHFPCTPEQAAGWLGFLADHLTRRRTHDLAWWQLGTTLPGRVRVLSIISTPVLATALTLGFPTRPGNVLASGLAFILVIALAMGLNDETREPKRLRRRGQRGRVTNTRTNTFQSAVVLACAHLLGRMNKVVVTPGDNHASQEAVDPWTLLRTDRTVALVDAIMSLLAFGLAGGFVLAPLLGLTAGPTDKLTIGIAIGFPLGLMSLLLSAWGDWLLFARLWLPLTRRLPWRPRRFLEDAHQRGVLRQTGAVYQFRHARLRDHLANQHRTNPRSTRQEATPGNTESSPAPEPH